jgi:hypothetical protein
MEGSDGSGEKESAARPKNLEFVGMRCDSCLAIYGVVSR